MQEFNTIKKSFLSEKENLFNSFYNYSDSLEFSKHLSKLVESYIKKVCKLFDFDFVVTSTGSFARNELSPYSDIDIMLITASTEKDKNQINNLITALFDCGIEVSHTVREFSDADLIFRNDLLSFTQFFETKFLYGNKKIYDDWNEKLISLVTTEEVKRLLQNFISDQKERYRKYGNSPKFLQPHIKFSAGGLRDLQTIGWLYLFVNKKSIIEDEMLSLTEYLLNEFVKSGFCTKTEGLNILNSFKFLLKIRHCIHLITNHKTDRFEFDLQIKVAEKLSKSYNHLTLLKQYFKSANCIYRFIKSSIKLFSFEIIETIPDALAFNLDDVYYIKGKVINANNLDQLQLSDFMKAFYYMDLYDAVFDSKLDSVIINRVCQQKQFDLIETESTKYFREILKHSKKVGEILSTMNELEFLGAFLSEFEELNGFMQVGVYHCYTADEHTLIAIKNLEKLYDDNSPLGIIFKKLENKELLYLALLFHDIAKPISIPGHNLLGAEIAEAVMRRLGYNDNEIELVCFLVKNHLHMEQVAFRRNLNDPITLDNFIRVVDSNLKNDMLYLITYADLSAVNPTVWTTWKSELLYELYLKIDKMLIDNINGEQLLHSTILISPNNISQHSNSISEATVKEHIKSLHDNVSYIGHFSDEAIAKHIEEIESGKDISVLFDQRGEFTHVTIITLDHPALLSKLCGVFTINDVNIHDARIFTRKDGIVIDSFNVLDFKTHSKLSEEKYSKLENDFHKAISGFLQLNIEVNKLKSRWKRLEKKFFSREGKIKISFNDHDKYTIIDISSPDRLGLLFHITREMNELGLTIYFAKISTKGDFVTDAFYVLNRFGNKIESFDFDLIRSRLTEAINQIL